ncbi:MAG: 1,4-dihydroxy-6-naphthoate synthase [Bacteroidales bacterium]|nr:1,4-dihydroxy-6-naphthoate synthase [Bacteroidales bacterium]
MKLTLAYSTCPNDTFIFDAIANHKIDTEGLEFEISLADIDVLNQNAVSENKPDITKISSNAYGINIWKDYVILNSGSALGRNNGPMLVAKNVFDISEMDSKKILIPGINTTANLLFTTFFPTAKNKTPMLFSKIENEVICGNYDAGLLIHEGRFTYKSKGLEKIVDFGEMWEKNFGMPIPLGSIIAKRSLPKEVIEKVDRIIRRSVEYSFANPDSPMPYIRENAREMDDNVMKSHIKLYVNDFSVDLGEIGRSAIEFLYQKAFENKFYEELPKEIFLSK